MISDDLTSMLSFLNIPGVLRSFDLRASFACLVCSETLTGRSSEKALLAAFPWNAQPGDDWFDRSELVRDWSDGVLFEWSCDVLLDDMWTDVLAVIKVAG